MSDDKMKGVLGCFWVSRRSDFGFGCYQDLKSGVRGDDGVTLTLACGLVENLQSDLACGLM